MWPKIMERHCNATHCANRNEQTPWGVLPMFNVVGLCRPKGCLFSRFLYTQGSENRRKSSSQGSDFTKWSVYSRNNVHCVTANCPHRHAAASNFKGGWLALFARQCMIVHASVAGGGEGWCNWCFIYNWTVAKLGWNLIGQNGTLALARAAF